LLVAFFIVCFIRHIRARKRALKQIRFITVFFGNELSQEEFNDDAKRFYALRSGVEKIKEKSKDLKMLREFGVCCAVSFSGTAEKVKELRKFLDSQGIAYQEEDPTKPMLRGA
jgi:hypothetical protein